MRSGRLGPNGKRLEVQLRSSESLHAQVHELFGVAQEHTKQLEQAANHIRSLARIPETHEARLSKLENRNGETP